MTFSLETTNPTNSIIPDPSIPTLLPPLLAHIQIAFTSAHPPTTLLPLLAPILRSRLRILAGTSAATTNTAAALSVPEESWLSLMTWSKCGGADLCRHLSSQDFSSHPSGEFEVGEYVFKGVRRVDGETLRASVELVERGVEVVYVWVWSGEDPEQAQEEEEEAEDQTRQEFADRMGKVNGEWKIVDMNLTNSDSATMCLGVFDEWYPTVEKAEEAYQLSHPASPAPPSSQTTATDIRQLTVPSTSCTRPPAFSHAAAAATSSAYYGHSSANNREDNAADDDNDDDYWNMYDRTPARSPAVPQSYSAGPSEDEYFARYANVEPALDGGSRCESSPEHTTARTSLSSTSLSSSYPYAYTHLRTPSPPTIAAAALPRQQQQQPHYEYDYGSNFFSPQPRHSVPSTEPSSVPEATTTISTFPNLLTPTSIPNPIPLSPPASSSSASSSSASSSSCSPKTQPQPQHQPTTTTPLATAPATAGPLLSSSPVSPVRTLELTALLHLQAETGVRQHICTTLKSLYRLAKVAGIPRDEFRRIVETEVDLLEVGDVEDEEGW